MKEIGVPFGLSLMVLTATALLTKSVNLLEIMVTQGVGGSFIFWFILSVLPSFLIYTLPVSFLIGVLAAFTRLSSDSEITAMKASGLSLYNLAKPVFVFAFVVYAASLAVTLYLFPWGNLNLKRLIFEASKERFISGLEEKTFYDRFKGVVLYVDKINLKSGEMEGIFISETGEKAELNIFFASKGIFSSATERQTVYLRLLDGTIHRKTEKDETYHIAGFQAYTLELGLTGQPGTAENRKNRELNGAELRQKIKDAEARGDDSSAYVIDLHKRFALPASVFVFGLMGVPLGLQRIRAARFTGFSVAIGVVLVYYVLSTAFEALGENGPLHPVFAVWASDIVFMAAGILIFARTAADRPVNPFSGMRRKR